MKILSKVYNMAVLIVNSIIEGRQMRADMYMSAHGIDGQKLDRIKIKNNS